ncbi:CHAT domain-containing protein [Rubrivivax gelatinosus]|uniref:CHAT domain-containing protein n=2 Tax=Rubrivivax gelatinosus TaxID=28068 RepID=A0ABS1DVW4_RUBGE|nr:CHAT domain-containing protein [Rubrivivax gelatinosus]MBK1615853.1 CHAT domain-containing protein [Rubrivivax gelatinosus]MBK1714174.1 CHAT domain-containing protein [Rubrivivax gelatinosus]
MALWQLIVHHDEDMREVLEDGVRAALASLQLPARCVGMRNIERADTALAEQGLENCSLVVIGSSTPADAASSIGLSGREPTMQFIRSLKRFWEPLPIVVISSTPDERLAGFLEAHRNTALLAADARLGPTLDDAVRGLLGTQPRLSAACVRLHIHLRESGSGSWEMLRTGGARLRSFRTGGTLALESGRFKEILYDSKCLDEDVSQDQFRPRSFAQLSNKLADLLFNGAPGNTECWRKFSQQRDEAGGMAHTRIRVTVDDTIHELMLEALKDPAPEGRLADCWILNAPMYRHAMPRGNEPLFRDPDSRNGAINALVIQADAAAGNLPLSEDRVLSLAALPHAAGEAQELETLLRRHARGVVRRLDFGDADPTPPGERLLKALTAEAPPQGWHLVHFCGHGFNARPHGASLVLRADRGGEMPVHRLATALARTQFFFLSSCHGAKDPAVLRALEQQVPALLGYQWKVSDERAGNFARLFYRALFEPGTPSYRYLEYAFMRARRQAYEQAVQEAEARLAIADAGAPAVSVDDSLRDHSWISPVLVMQME